MANSIAPTKFPDKDPYEVLRLSHDASDVEIAKAYRQLARELHPDKHAGKSSMTRDKIEAMKVKFHEIQMARSFLLDAEFSADRKKYDTKLASERSRKVLEKVRETNMSESRKRMRDLLNQQEMLAARKSTSSSIPNERQHINKSADSIDKLARDGKRRQQDYAKHMATTEFEYELKKQKESERFTQASQIRLKWSRKKMQMNVSVAYITKLLSPMGSVISVEMIGSKGNTALVTFADPSSCRKVIDYYASSDEMRATFVSKTNETYENDDYDLAPNSLETVEDWKERREVERERVEHAMKMGTDAPFITKVGKVTTQKQTSNTNSFPSRRWYSDGKSSNSSSPMEWLEQYEEIVLSKLLSRQSIEEIKVLKTLT